MQIIHVELGGYYIVREKLNDTHVVIENLGYSSNSPPGNFIYVGSLVSPGGIEGPDGAPGTPGAGAYSALFAGYQQPPVEDNVVIGVFNTTVFYAGAYAFVTNGGGYYRVFAVSPTSLTLTNIGTPNANTDPGNLIPGIVGISTAYVILCGPPGPAFNQRFRALGLPAPGYPSDVLPLGNSFVRFNTINGYYDQEGFPLTATDTLMTVNVTGNYEVCITLKLNFVSVVAWWQAVPFRAILLINGNPQQWPSIDMATWSTNDDIIQSSICTYLQLSAGNTLEWRLSNAASDPNFTPGAVFFLMMTRYQ